VYLWFKAFSGFPETSRVNPSGLFCLKNEEKVGFVDFFVVSTKEVITASSADLVLDRVVFTTDNSLFNDAMLD
jgi:hypothetical protein